MNALWNSLLQVWYEDAFGVFLTGFTVTLLLPLIVVGCFLVVFFRVPTAFGLAKLFWRPTWGKRFVAGLGMGALLWQTLLAGYLFEPLATNFTLDRPPYCDVQPRADGYTPGLSESADPMLAARWSDNPELRYDPAEIGSVCGYLWALTRGAVVGSLVIFVVSSFFFALFGVLARSWYATFGPARVPPPTGHEPAVADQAATPPCDAPADGPTKVDPSGPSLARRVWMWLALPLGVAGGFALTAGVSSALWKSKYLNWDGPPYRDFVLDPDGQILPAEESGGESVRADGVAYRVGQGMVRLAQYGKADARQEFNERRLGVSENYKTLTPERAGQGLPKYYETYFDSAYPGGTITRLRPYYPVFGAFLITFVLLVGAYLLFLLVDVWWCSVTPSSGLLFILQAVLAAHVVMSYFAATPHLSNLGLLLLMLFSAVAYKLRFRGITAPGADPKLPFDRYDKPVKLADYSQAKPPCLLDPKTDVDFRGDDGRKRPMAIVCVSGGGSRAAAWTMKMLTELEAQFAAKKVSGKTGYAFPYDIRLITGASGGIIAGAYYAAGLAAPGGNGEVMRVKPLTDAAAARNGDMPAVLNDAIRQDFLTPIARKVAFWDLASIFIPAVFRKDRGTALEQAWDAALHGVMRTTFAELKQGEADGWRPSLIVSPMTVEDGRQLFISNLEMIKVTENRANILRGKGKTEPTADTDLLSREGWTFFKLFPEAHGTFQVGTAARMSASFPFVLPAVELPTEPPLRVVDAGYYDNFGVGIASAWLAANLPWVKENCSGVVVIQIRDGVSEASRREQPVGLPAAPSRFRRGLHWLSSPVEGLYSFRSQATAYRNDNLLAMLTTRFQLGFHDDQGTHQSFGNGFFQTAALELPCGDDVSLNFTLTEEEKANIDAGAKDPLVQDRITALIEWWTTRPGDGPPVSAGSYHQPPPREV